MKTPKTVLVFLLICKSLMEDVNESFRGHEDASTDGQYAPQCRQREGAQTPTCQNRLAPEQESHVLRPTHKKYISTFNMHHAEWERW